MGSKWRTTGRLMREEGCLSELVTIRRGTTYKSALLGLPGPVLLGLAAIARNGGFRSDNLKTYGGESPESLLVQPGQLFASLKDVTQSADLLGSVARVPSGSVAGRLTQDTVRIDVVSDRICPDFLYLSLLTPKYRDYCRRHATGTTTLGLQREDFLAYQIWLPPLDEQRRIAGVLGALDDLIEVNRGLIKNLLETVDAAFSRNFEQRELTLTLGSFTKVVDCLHSKKPERIKSSHRLLQLSNIEDSGQLDTNDFYGISRDDYVRWTKNLETREWDCVITNVGRVGAVARIPSGVHAALGRNMTAIRPIDPESDGAFVIAALRARPVRREIELKTDTGTVMDALNVKNIPNLRLPQASSDERAAFQSIAAPLLRAADDLKSENSLLVSSRDELLPLLMSGRVRVREDGVAA